MKFVYAYRQSDGIRRESSIEAKSREAVFEILRARGIKAIKVIAADGSKANGEFRGVRKRMLVVTVIVTALATIVGTIASIRFFNGSPSLQEFQSDTTRRHPIGDAAMIEKGVRTGWSDVFPDEGERFFASFAVPGVKAGQRSTTIEELTAALARTIPVKASDRIEVRQIKAMVEGMKAEARQYIADGGSVVEYGKRLTERQDAEIAAYNRVRTDIEAAKTKMPRDQFEQFCDRRNDELRNLGIRPIVVED